MNTSLYKKILLRITRYLAERILRKYQPQQVVITGSVGKTSTKQALLSVITDVSSVYSSEVSIRSEFSLYCTIIGVPHPGKRLGGLLRVLWRGCVLVCTQKQDAYPQVLVFEMGIKHSGDTARIAQMLEPDVVVVTPFGTPPTHIEFFDTVQALITEKIAVIDQMKRSGIVVLPQDDEYLEDIKRKIKVPVVSYGFDPQSTLVVSHPEIAYADGVPIGMRFRANFEGKSLPSILYGALGVTHVLANAAALATAEVLDISLIQALTSLESNDAPPGRMKLIHGVYDTMIIDDTYNASPVAMSAALKTLAHLETRGRKIAILGDMLDLGRHAEQAHRTVGEEVVESADVVIAVGVRAQFIAENARKKGMKRRSSIMTFSTSAQAGAYAKTILKEGDIILVKGSQDMRMERVVEQIMSNPKDKETLLVRQNDFWLHHNHID